jgi:hypothetical protein
MRYSNLSNNMMISKLWTTITIQIQYSMLMAGSTHDRRNSAPEQAEHPYPHQIMLDP